MNEQVNESTADLSSVPRALLEMEENLMRKNAEINARRKEVEQRRAMQASSSASSSRTAAAVSSTATASGLELHGERYKYCPMPRFLRVLITTS